MESFRHRSAKSTGTLCAPADNLFVLELDNSFTGFIQISRKQVTIAVRAVVASSVGHHQPSLQPS